MVEKKLRVCQEDIHVKCLPLLFVFTAMTLILYSGQYNQLAAAALEANGPVKREQRIKLQGSVLKNTPPFITVSDLEKMSITEYEVHDPYLGSPVVYQGVLLREFVKAYGQKDTELLKIRAIDDYKAEFGKDEWRQWDIMLATRMAGKQMGLREKGPVKIVMPYDTAKGMNQTLFNPKWIWQINRIEFVGNTQLIK